MERLPDFLPPGVLMIVLPYWSKLLEWLSGQVYQRLVVQISRDHWLVRLQAKLDTAPLERVCAAYQHSAGPGSPVVHGVPQLVRARLVKHLYHWPLREAESQIRTHRVVKWFVGYRLWAAGPDHTTLERFEQWVCEHQHRQFFDQVLTQIDRDFPDERTQPQVGDTFAMQADAARESLVCLLRHTCQRLLCSLAQLDPHALATLQPHYDAEALFGPAHEVNAFYLNEAARLARLQTTARAALACGQAVRRYLAECTTHLATEARPELTQHLAQLDKILADELSIRPDPAGGPSQISPLPAKEQGSFRLGSATDPEATFRLHGAHKQDLGYNVNLAVTPRFVREIQALTGAQPDTVALPALLTAQWEHSGFLPAKLIYDAAAGEAKTRARVREATQGQTQLVAPLRQAHQAANHFPPSAFTLSADDTTLTCPNGQTTPHFTRTRTNDSGRLFSFRSRQCQGCPLWSQCRSPKAKPSAPRQVFISDYRQELLAAQAYNQTSQYRLDMQLRPLVEQIIAALTRHNGARRARRRGERAADFQAKMAAMAFNIKRWLRLLPPPSALLAVATT